MVSPRIELGAIYRLTKGSTRGIKAYEGEYFMPVRWSQFLGLVYARFNGGDRILVSEMEDEYELISTEDYRE